MSDLRVTELPIEEQHELLRQIENRNFELQLQNIFMESGIAALNGLRGEGERK